MLIEIIAVAVVAILTAVIMWRLAPAAADEPAAVIAQATRTMTATKAAAAEAAAAAAATATTTGGGKHGKGRKKAAADAETPKHPLLFRELKGHADGVHGVCFSADKRLLATVGADRMLRVYDCDSLTDADPKVLRVALDRDHAVDVAFSGDGHHAILLMSNGELRFFAIPKQIGVAGKHATQELAHQTQHKHPRTAVCSSNNRILTCDAEGRVLRLWTPGKGALTHLATVQTAQLELPQHMAAITSDGVLLAHSSFTSEVKIWEVTTGKSGDFDTVSPAMTLNGHKAAIHCVSFTTDRRRVVTCSKDCTVRVWDIEVDYKRSFQPKELAQIKLEQAAASALVAPDGSIIAVVCGSDILFYTLAGGFIDSIKSAHGEATCVRWSADGTLLAVTSDRVTKLWKNPLKAVPEADTR